MDFPAVEAKIRTVVWERHATRRNKQGRMGQDGAGWGRMGQDEAGWGRLGQDGAGIKARKYVVLVPKLSPICREFQSLTYSSVFVLYQDKDTGLSSTGVLSWASGCPSPELKMGLRIGLE